MFSLCPFPFFVSFTFIVYIGNFNLWWAKKQKCKVIYCSDTTGETPGKILYFQFPNPKTKRKKGEIWLNNIISGYNISSYKIMLSVVTTSMAIEMQAKLLGYVPRRRTLKFEALPNILKHNLFSIVNINCETADRIQI